jgi:hypothetical protein
MQPDGAEEASTPALGHGRRWLGCRGAKTWRSILRLEEHQHLPRGRGVPNDAGIRPRPRPKPIRAHASGARCLVPPLSGLLPATAVDSPHSGSSGVHPARVPIPLSLRAAGAYGGWSRHSTARPGFLPIPLRQSDTTADRYPCRPEGEDDAAVSGRTQAL